MRYLSFIMRQLGRNCQHGWTSQIMTLFTVSLSVLIFSFFYLVYTNMETASARLDYELRLVVFLEDEVPVGFRPASLAPAVLAQPVQPPTMAEYSIIPTTEG